MNPARVCLVGVGGYARVHLRHLVDFHSRGLLRFVGAVALPAEMEMDPEARTAAEACGTRLFASFESMREALPELRADLVVLPTPIHLHVPMAVTLLRAGVHVLVEKPLTATARELEELLRVEAQTRRLLAVGFQYLHAGEVQALKAALDAGAIGRIRRMSVHAAWPRSHSYYTRNDWAGRLRVNDAAVFDSPVTNAMSHFLMLMLFLAGRRTGEPARPQRVSAELYRAQRIESFDTCVLHYEADGTRFDFYGTHSSRAVERPSLLIEGADGRAEWVQDSHATIERGIARKVFEAKPESATREQMLRDVLARVRGEASFVCTATMAGAHVHSIAALHERGAIVDVPANCVKQREEDGQVFSYVENLDQPLLDASRRGVGLREAGVPWAVAPQAIELL
ncbi:MAG: Gfo/Idh/MocA family oxidoreductase [Opitutae bacterium]|nr:Gfo/Idh/MocA family oxidoreductase [Opitutae bacterium]